MILNLFKINKQLKAMGVKIDTLTKEQYNYIHGYEEGT